MGGELLEQKGKSSYHIMKLSICFPKWFLQAYFFFFNREALLTLLVLCIDTLRDSNNNSLDVSVRLVSENREGTNEAGTLETPALVSHPTLPQGLVFGFT